MSGSQPCWVHGVAPRISAPVLGVPCLTRGRPQPARAPAAGCAPDVLPQGRIRSSLRLIRRAGEEGRGKPACGSSRRARRRPAMSRPAGRGSGRRSRWRSALAARSRRRMTSRTAVGRAREHQEVRHREVVLVVLVAPDEVGVVGESGTGGDRIRGVAWAELCDARGSLPGGPTAVRVARDDHDRRRIGRCRAGCSAEVGGAVSASRGPQVRREVRRCSRADRQAGSCCVPRSCRRGATI
jgi:hypothetical protein